MAMNGSEKRQICRAGRAIVGSWMKHMLDTSVPKMQIAEMQTFFVEQIETPTGRMRIVCDDAHNLRAVDWEDHEQRMHALLRRYYGANAVHLRQALRPSPATRALRAYFDGDLDAIAALPTASNGTAFQHAVWSALRQIPAGRTVSYGVLARQIGRPKAVRAVGAANGANPIAIVVPCHRLIGADASLTGYGGGLHRKKWLLAHERSARPLLHDARAEAER
jgi:methylated-DNA-[protein]-cysteine S-methyltransferase